MVARHVTSPPLVGAGPAKGRPADLIQLIEGANSFGSSDGARQHRIVRAAGAVLGPGHGIAGWFFRVAPDLRNKEVTASTASQHLTSGVRKLGLCSRIELVNLMRFGRARVARGSKGAIGAG